MLLHVSVGHMLAGDVGRTTKLVGWASASVLACLGWPYVVWQVGRIRRLAG